MRVDPLGPPPSLPPEFLKSPSSTARQHGTSNSSELTAKEEDYDDEFDAQISSWSVVVPYEADISSALQKARQREFANHFSTWASIEEATIEATGTILDIKYVTNDGPPGMCTTCPLPSKTLESVFGTNKPTEKVLQQKTQRAITRLLLKEWWLDDSPEFCLQSYYVVLYEKRGADLTPSKIAFAGWSDNC